MDSGSVSSHTQLISQWIKEGRIKPEVPVEERVV